MDLSTKNYICVEEGEKVGGLLDFVTGIAERNNINVQNISCVTGIAGTNDISICLPNPKP